MTGLADPVEVLRRMGRLRHDDTRAFVRTAVEFAALVGLAGGDGDPAAVWPSPWSRPARVLVVGSARFDDRELFVRALEQLRRELGGRRIVLVHPDGGGAGKLAAELCQGRPDAYLEEVHPLEHYRTSGEPDGGAAARRRARALIARGASACLAFPDLRGANRAVFAYVLMARRAGIEARVYWGEQPGAPDRVRRLTRA